MQKTNSYSQEWLNRAREDILWAESSFRGGSFNGVCFISQQIIEKSLKAFLIFHKQKLIKTHDLILLNKNCEKINNQFEKFNLVCELVSKYYIDTRYPDLYIEKPKQEAEDALNGAKEIFEFVKLKLI